MARLDHPRIVAAIAAAEAQTSGEIRVYVQRGEVQEDPLTFAEQKFVEFGMEKTTAHNAVLILATGLPVAVRVCRFARPRFTGICPCRGAGGLLVHLLTDLLGGLDQILGGVSNSIRIAALHRFQAFHSDFVAQVSSSPGWLAADAQAEGA